MLFVRKRADSSADRKIEAASVILKAHVFFNSNVPYSGRGNLPLVSNKPRQRRRTSTVPVLQAPCELPDVRMPSNSNVKLAWLDERLRLHSGLR